MEGESNGSFVVRFSANGVIDYKRRKEKKSGYKRREEMRRGYKRSCYKAVIREAVAREEVIIEEKRL